MTGCPSCGLLSDRAQKACAVIGPTFSGTCDGPFTVTLPPRVVRKSGFCLRPAGTLGAHRFCTTPGCECGCHKIPERSGTEEVS